MSQQKRARKKKEKAEPARPLHPSQIQWPQAKLNWSRDRDWFNGSEVILSRKAADTAVIFVHGWGGKAVGTWESFPEYLASVQGADRADIYFLEYPSRQSQLAFCAAQLRHFFFDIARDPLAAVVQPSLPSGAEGSRRKQTYKKILVIAHSMGAVVCRRALLDLDTPANVGLSDDELATFRLLLFAPAHCGSHIPSMVAAGFGLNFLPGVETIVQFLRLYMQSLRDLEEGSVTLQRLADDNRSKREERVSRSAATEHLVATVYHAHRDRVVNQNSFDGDPPLRPVMNQTHTSICKPGASYQVPLEALIEILS